MKNLVAKINSEKLKAWRAERELVNILVDPKYIILTENIHIGVRDNKFIKQQAEKIKDCDFVDKNIIIRPFKDKYSLVMGINGLKIARLLNKPISCIVVGQTMTHNVIANRIGLIAEDYKYPTGTEDIIEISDIKIPNAFTRAEARPSRVKYQAHMGYFKANDTVDKPITVENLNGRISLKDGYIRYLILINEGRQLAPVKYV
jgi:hypothetical protein